MSEDTFLKKAIEKAKESVVQGGFPAGAIVVKDGEIIGKGISIGNKLNDPTSHGEMAAIRDACKNLVTSDLSDSVLYASMEPCSMCFSAAMWSLVPKIVFACSKEKVSDEYYGGHYQTTTLNDSFTKPLELVQLKELENKAFDIVNEWEASIK